LAGSVLIATALLPGAVRAAEILPPPPAPFAGTIGPSRDTSTPAWPLPVKAPAGAPNVVLILLDDVGFSATRTFGGAIDSPVLDHLAAEGLRYNTFHVTSLCSPTRAALLTGRNEHQVGFGVVADAASGFPGYNSVWNRNSASIAEILKQNGYSTAAFGKWHNTPTWEINPAGPFDRWPTGLGFEYFYGFLGGLDSQWETRLYRNTNPVEPRQSAAQGYQLTTDLADDAIHWLRQHDAVAPDKPFFVYFAPGATHWPLHVAPEWSAKYKGKFDQGWDKLREETFARQKAAGVIPANAELTPRPKELPAWDSLSPEEKALHARHAEVYAGFLEQTDHEVGRLLDEIGRQGKGNDTLVLYIVGDNGASFGGGPEGFDVVTAEGKAESTANRLARAGELGSATLYNSYSAAWAWAQNTPFQYGKQVASHLGGTRDPLVVSWPARIKDKGALRSQFGHVNDIAPTIYEAAGIRFPTVVNGAPQIPLEGKSLLATFDDPKAASQHTTQYFEKVGNRAIYKDGWWAGARHLLTWESRAPGAWEKTPVGRWPWELYNLTEDYAQAHDLAAVYPEKLKELQAAFDAEAARNQVNPLAPYRERAPQLADRPTRATFREGVERLPEHAVPAVANRPHTLTAEVEVPASGAEGVILAQGGRWGGFALYVKNGAVVYENNAFGATHTTLVSTRPLPAGRVTISVAVAEGVGRLSIDGQPAGEAPIGRQGAVWRETLDVGKDLGSTVSEAYDGPFPFTGRVVAVTLARTEAAAAAR